ncbi:MAG: hypothetical protein ACRYGF_11380 [Janthinobacterium lividum]
MFLRRLQIDRVTTVGEVVPCPIAWIDNFAMRNFTNDAVFDDTLPVGDGMMEAGLLVPLDLLRERMEAWFRRKGYLSPDETLRVQEVENAIAERAPCIHDAIL